MLRIDVHQAESRLTELVRVVEERNETVVLCRNGVEIAEIRRRPAARKPRDLAPDPLLLVTLSPGYDPTEPLSPDEWPDDDTSTAAKTRAPMGSD